MPTVSVMMPVYNSAPYLEQAIESVLGQTLEDLELIAVDDGSTDESPEILERYKARDPRVQVARAARRGVTAARNDALARATGEFCAVMDSDDVALPDRLAIQVAYLRGDPGCVGVGGQALTIDSEGEPLGRWNLPLDHESIDASNLRARQAIVHPAFTARREVMVAVGGYRPGFELCEDLDLFLRMAERGRLTNVPQPVVSVRRHPTSTVHTQARRLYENLRRAVTEARARRGLEAEELAEFTSVDLSLADHHRSWAWTALEMGHLGTARKHTCRALRLQPFSPENWKLFSCVYLRSRLRQRVRGAD